MMKMCIMLASIVSMSFFAVSPGLADMGMEWENASSGIRDADLHSFAVCPSDPAVAYAASYKALYRTTDNGDTWIEMLSLRGTDNGIYTLAANPLNPQLVYAGTAKGLFRSSDQGMHWERIFQDVGEPENMIYAVYINLNRSENIYIGTSDGIFFTDDNGITWERVRNLPAYSIVTSITGDAHDARVLYAASFRGIYKTADSGASWNRVFESDLDDSDLHFFIGDEDDSRDEADITGMRDVSHVRKVIHDPKKPNTLYAATSRGMLFTHDGGRTWTPSGSIGLVSYNIRDIAIHADSPEHVYAATDRGVLRYTPNAERWDEIYKGMASSDIRILAFAPGVKNGLSVLWAVTRNSVYRSSLLLPVVSPEHTGSRDSAEETDDVLRMFDHEPSIEEIKEAAIEYAEVSPEKIRAWRRAAANRAWLPDISMKYGGSRDWQNSSYFYSTRDEKYKDDDITEGKDNDWYISLTWNLGDLIWNDAQSSIDNRSKLMVQLRGDVLNEVTRLYFERRRLQIELLMTPPGNQTEYIDKELRLQELTASIDALTGSVLSKRTMQKGIGAQRQDVTVK